MKLEELKNKKILIVGYGKEGKATEQYLRAKLPDIHLSIVDQKDGPNYLDKQKNFDLAIKSPGITKDLITIPYTTATNIFFANLGTNKTIGVTGSKGKSTTASLIYSILREADKKVHLVGNIGNPMLEQILEPYSDDDIFVIELSSYQLEDIKYSPHIAVIVSLFPDHLNYHGGKENYYQAKKNILKQQTEGDYYIYNPLFAELASWAKETKAKSIAYTDNLPITDEEIPLLGEHNKQNVKAAVTVAHLFHIDDLHIFKAIKSFTPLPHRLEKVGTFQEITFYDDAISTTPESTIAALQALKNVDTILLGGENRGYDFSQLVEKIAQNSISNIVLFPDSGADILQKLKEKSLNYIQTMETDSMEMAVYFAYQNTKKGSICLLSTASPSYSLWKNFEEKGNEFQKFVKKFR